MQDNMTNGMNSNRPISISITTGTVIKIILLFLAIYLLYLIKDVLAILFISLILSSAFDPWVDWLQTKKIPRSLSIILIYLVTLSVFGLVIYLMIPPIVEQVSELATNFPRYIERISSSYKIIRDFTQQYGILDNLKSWLGGLSSGLQGAAGSIFSTVTGIFGGILSFFLILIITFYMVVEETAIKKLVWSIAPAKHQTYVIHLINRIQIKTGLWLRGQLILMVIIFVLTFIGLSILGIKYALILALVAGIAELIPYLGPIIAAVPAVFLAFTQSPTLALLTAVLYYVIQMVENNILVPKVMEKALGLHPIISISALLIGLQLGGVVGALLAIPVATAVSVFVMDVFDNKEASERNLMEE